jgi:hypothetical protein
VVAGPPGAVTSAGAAAAALLGSVGGTGTSIGGTSLFEEEPVPLDVFVRDRAYLANPPLSDVQYEAVRHAERVYYPATYDLLAQSADKQVREYWAQPTRMVNFLELEWGKGGGKDHTCRMIAMRVCYLLLCLRSPQDYYAMPEQDSIHVLNVASSSKQAQRAFFAPMRRAVQRPGCWFQRNAGVDILDAAERQRRGARGERTVTLLDTIRFEHNIEAVSGHSDADSQEGLNLILGIADEIDAFRSAAELARNAGPKQRESSSSAEAILDMIRTSATTRFPQTFKNVHISYPRYLGSTIQQLVAKGKADNEQRGDSSRYYVSGPLASWEANPRLRGKEDFAEDYEKDPAMAEAKYECKPRRAINPYFANEQAIRDCLIEYVQPPVSVAYVREGATWRPLYTFSSEFFPVKGALYAMHADLAATGDRAGVSMAHVKRWQDHALTGYDEEGLEIKVSERRPVVKVDFTVSYESDPGARPPMEIQIRWARMLCLELRRMGFPVVRFTFDQWQCFTGDMQIQLLDGTSVRLDELARRSAAGQDAWVYSCTPDGRIVPGRCPRAWQTGFREDIVEVELDNGERVRCTSDHRWMMRDGTYRRALELQPGDSLMPLYRQFRKIGPSTQEYEQVRHPATGKWEFTHRMVAQALGFPAPRGHVIHHGFDGLRHLNNDPRNLRRMTNEEHSALHKGTPEWRERQAAARRAEKGLRTGRDHNAFRQDISFEEIKAAAEQVLAAGDSLTWRAVAKIVGCGSQWPIYHRVRESGFSSWKEFKWSVQPRSYGALAMDRHREKRALNNHKVVAVRPAAPEPVYDIEVEEHHNFALKAGVFVHNSKDSMQILESHGIETDRFSTDVSEEGWRTLRDVMYEGRLEMPSRELTVIELLGLSRLPNGKIDHLGDSCFVGSTRVPLLDGRDVQIKELADGKPVWVYSSDDQGCIVPALAVGRKTRQTRQLCDVVLTTGATIRCTPEHLWRLRDGSYKEAQALQPKDRLMPIFRKYDTNSGYEKVTDRDSRLSWTHVLVREYLDGQPLGPEEVSHHDNEVKTDNRPENLIRMDRVAHLAHHATKRHSEDDGYRQTLRAAQQAYWSSPEARARQAEVARESNRRRSNIREYHAARMDLLRSAIDARSVGAAARRVGLARNSALTVLRLHGFDSWEDFKAQDGLNHRVKFTELVELEEPVWVYDLEVDGFHNFALTAGVFVHNSKDEADSLAGAVAGALEIGGQEDPGGKRAYPGQTSFFGPASEIPAPAGMPAALSVLGPDHFMPPDRPGMEFGSSYLDDWGSVSGDYLQ